MKNFDGFIKTTDVRKHDLSGPQRTALIRKGNEFFNNKQYEQAKRIFLTVGYTDGITRMGDYYYKKNNVLEALRMYILAPAPDKKDGMIEKMAYIVQLLLHEKV
jgi:uncharacterized protein YifE (UPF0438 family)